MISMLTLLEQDQHLRIILTDCIAAGGQQSTVLRLGLFVAPSVRTL